MDTLTEETKSVCFTKCDKTALSLCDYARVIPFEHIITLLYLFPAVFFFGRVVLEFWELSVCLSACPSAALVLCLYGGADSYKKEGLARSCSRPATGRPGISYHTPVHYTSHLLLLVFSICWDFVVVGAVGILHLLHLHLRWPGLAGRCLYAHLHTHHKHNTQPASNQTSKTHSKVCFRSEDYSHVIWTFVLQNTSTHHLRSISVIVTITTSFCASCCIKPTNRPGQPNPHTPHVFQASLTHTLTHAMFSLPLFLPHLALKEALWTADHMDLKHTGC